MNNLKFHLLIVAILSLFVWSCDNPSGTKKDTVSTDELLLEGKTGVVSGATTMAKKPGSSEETIGNNLSFPVIWSDGVEKPLRGEELTSNLNGGFFSADGSDWYVQNDPANEWQAENVNAIADGGFESPVIVSAIDWGDNLESRAWPFGAQVRVETVLYKTLDQSMEAFMMQIEDPNASGLAEVWGTNGQTYLSTEATVYSGTAKLVIQQLQKERDDPTLTTTWDPIHSQWTGDVGPPLFESGVWEAVDGPGDYNAEINVQGKVIYGYNWVTRKTAAGPGDYRITFVLDPNSNVTYNTDFNNTTIVPREEEEIVVEEEPDLGGGVAEVDNDNNLTYIDVRLTLKNGGGKPGGGNGGGKGNGRGGGKPDHSGNGGNH